MVGMFVTIASPTRASGPSSFNARIIPARSSRPTSRRSPSTTGNSLWLVRNSVSTAASMCSSAVSVAISVIIAALTGTSRDIARIATSCASDEAAR